MKDLDKKIIIFSIIGFLFLLGYFFLSIIVVIETSIIRSFFLLIIQIILYLLFLIFAVIAIIFAIMNYKKSNTNSNTRKILIAIFSSYAIIIIFSLLFPKILEIKKEQTIEERIVTPAKKVIEKTITEDKDIYLIDDIKKKNKDVNYKNSSYIKNFNNNTTFCLESNNYIISGTLDDYKVDTSLTEKDTCELDLTEEEVNTYLKKYYEENYKDLNIEEITSERVCPTNGLIIKCRDEYNAKIDTYYGQIDSYLSRENGKLKITDNLEEIYNNLDEKTKTLSKVATYIEDYQNIDTITINNDIYDVYYNSSYPDIIMIMSSLDIEEGYQFIESLANYMKEDNVSIIFGKRVWGENRESVTFAYSIYLNITNGEITLRSEENS